MTHHKNSEFTTEPNVRLSDRYFEAVAYASQLHEGQTRKGTNIPYISHLLGVSSLVLEALGDEEQAIGALLHDAAEDCGGESRLVEIESLYGERVAGIVRGCSDSLSEDPDEKDDWMKRKEAYLKHLAQADADVVLVSAADKLHNARSLWTDIQRDGTDTMKRFNESGARTAWYYVEIAQILVDKQVPSEILTPYLEVVGNLVGVLSMPTTQTR